MIRYWWKFLQAKHYFGKCVSYLFTTTFPNKYIFSFRNILLQRYETETKPRLKAVIPSHGQGRKNKVCHGVMVEQTTIQSQIAAQPTPAQPSPARSHSCDIFTQALSNKHGDYTIHIPFTIANTASPSQSQYPVLYVNAELSTINK